MAACSPYFLKMRSTTSSLPVMGEIDVDIRKLVQHHAVAVEEPPEIQFKPDRANIGDAQAVTDKTIRRTAANDPLDPFRFAIFENSPRQEEIFLITNLRDDAQFLFNLGEYLLKHPRLWSVTALDSFHGKSAQKSMRAASISRVIPRKSQASQLEFKIALFGDFQRIPECIGMSAQF